jgi:hypothetical protein
MRYCLNKIAEAEAAMSVNENKSLEMHMHVQLKLDELHVLLLDLEGAPELTNTPMPK